MNKHWELRLGEYFSLTEYLFYKCMDGNNMALTCICLIWDVVTLHLKGIYNYRRKISSNSSDVVTFHLKGIYNLSFVNDKLHFDVVAFHLKGIYNSTEQVWQFHEDVATFHLKGIYNEVYGSKF